MLVFLIKTFLSLKLLSLTLPRKLSSPKVVTLILISWGVRQESIVLKFVVYLIFELPPLLTQNRWLTGEPVEILPNEQKFEALTEIVAGRWRELQIEPPTTIQVERLIKSAIAIT